jgi:hypothetical protein
MVNLRDSGPDPQDAGRGNGTLTFDSVLAKLLKMAKAEPQRQAPSGV